MNVEEVFFSIAKDIKQRLAEFDSKSEVFFTSQKTSICFLLAKGFMPLLRVIIFNFLFIYVYPFWWFSLRQSKLTNQIKQLVVVKLPKSRLAAVHKGNPSMWFEGEDWGVELICWTLWWVHVFSPLLFIPAMRIGMLKAVLFSVNFWNL